MLDTLKLFINKYASKTNKNIVLFVNGYRFGFPESPDTDNTITRDDRFQYWDGIDSQFGTRLNSATWLYADGHHTIATSNHVDMGHFYCSAKNTIPPIPESMKEAGLKYAGDVLTIALPTPVNILIKESELVYCNEYIGGKLNTQPNQNGFDVRVSNGKIAAQDLLNDIKEGRIKVNISNGKIIDTLDIVAHSMGFAYAQGMIEELKGKIPLGGYYIIAPENAGSGNVNTRLFNPTQVWQYGADGRDPLSKQDGVAPQIVIKGLTENNRAYIPDNVPKGFVSSHVIRNYSWIFKQSSKAQGYVKGR